MFLIREAWLRIRELFSIEDHLIPHVYSFNKPKEVYDDLTNIFEGKKINRKMTLRNHMKNVKIQNSGTI